MHGFRSFVGWMGLGLAAASAPGVTRYVTPDSPSPAPPYTSWSTAAHEIQAAVDVSTGGDLVLVSNGVYATGGAPIPGYDLTNRVMVASAITVSSVHGPAATIIQGQYDPNSNGPGPLAVRCAAVFNGSLNGFTLEGGASATTPYDLYAIAGGGLLQYAGTASNLVIQNCRSDYAGGGVILNNAAVLTHSVVRQNWTDGVGGGVLFNGTCQMRNCLVVQNTAQRGGGAEIYMDGLIESCTIAGNEAAESGGLYARWGTRQVVNTIVYSNRAPSNREYDIGTNMNIFSFSCTDPLPPGPGNIASDPRFVTPSNFHIRPVSPCVDAGTNQPWMFPLGADIDGERRVRGGVVDIGADEGRTLLCLSIGLVSGRVSSTWDTLSDVVLKPEVCYSPGQMLWTNNGWLVTGVNERVIITDPSPTSSYRLLRLLEPGPH